MHPDDAMIKELHNCTPRSTEENHPNKMGEIKKGFQEKC